MQLGYKLFAEGYGPLELVRQAELAERAGFDFVEISDHFHPWLPDEDHGHSGFAFAILGMIAGRTSDLGLMTGVTCPTFRYHPAIVAQAAATLGVLSDGRFALGIGSGERLNEHIVGQGWPGVAERHARLREALEIINLLWDGGYQTYDGDFFSIDTARVFDLPDIRPTIAVAAGGPKAARIAAELGTGLMTTEPKRELVDAFAAAGGGGPRYCEVSMSYAPTEAAGAESARKLFRFGTLGWKVMPELPNPANFEAASAAVTADDMLDSFACGNDPERFIEQAQQFTDAGFDHLVLTNAGSDVNGFFDFFTQELQVPLRALEPASLAVR